VAVVLRTELDVFRAVLRHLWLCDAPHLTLLVLRLWTARGLLVTADYVRNTKNYDMRSIRTLAWGSARLGESAATLYTRSPGADEFCAGATCLDIARWCAVRTRDRRGLALMRDEADGVEDERAAALLQRRLAYFR
jgi:hypothetical protein